MKKYTIEEVKSQQIWVKCTGEKAIKLLKSIDPKIKIFGDKLFYRYREGSLEDYDCMNMPPDNYIEFEQVIFPEEEVKETRKKTGRYFAPFDMFFNSVRKGDIYKKDRNDSGYYHINDSNSETKFLPAEWIESSWEPEYEYEEEKIMIGGNEIKFCKYSIEIKGFNYKINFFEDLAHLMMRNDLKSLEFSNGSDPLTLETINKILEKLK